MDVSLIISGEKVKIRTRIQLGFLAVILLGAVIGAISIYQLKMIAKPLGGSIAKNLKAIEETSHLDDLSNMIRYYDEVLTQSARNYAFTQDKRWKERYKEDEPVLDKIIKEALALGDAKDKELFTKIDASNRALVKMEYASIDLVDKGDPKGAVDILEDKAYWDQKKIYARGLESYIARRDALEREALSASYKTLDLEIAQADKLTRNSATIISILIILAIISASIISIFISRSISKPLSGLVDATERIGKGDLDVRAIVSSKDEIGELAEQFNDMTENLKTSIASLDRLNSEIALRKQAENVLKENELKYRTLFESSTDAIMILDPEKGFLSGNASAIKIFNCKDEREFISKDPAMLSPERQPDGRLSREKSLEMMNIAMEKGSHLFEWTHKRCDGEEFFATVLLSSTEFEGKPVLQATVRDITEEKKMRAKVAEAMEARSQFISVVSHELRTPLAALKEGIITVLNGTLGGINTDQKDFLDLAKRNVDRLTRLINDVLDYQKLDAGKVAFNMQKADINQLINEAIKVMQPAAKSKGLYLEARPAPFLPQAMIDKDRITQVLMNLLNNAVKFTDKGGVTVTTLKEGGAILVSVRDTGKGIKKEDLSKLFRGFSQLEPDVSGSTGLGLSISKRIILEHKGDIWVESEPGKGSDFKFKLPLA